MGLPLVPDEPTEEYFLEVLGLGLEILVEEADWLICCLGKKEEAEVALIVLLIESLLVSGFEEEED